MRPDQGNHARGEHRIRGERRLIRPGRPSRWLNRELTRLEFTNPVPVARLVSEADKNR
jgi:hypothetical protein